MASTRQTLAEEHRPRTLNPDEQREVIALAAHLQSQHDARRAEELTVEQLETAAAEAGIDPAFVREAVVELTKQWARRRDEEKRRKALRHVFRFLGALGAMHLIGAAGPFAGQPVITIVMAGLEIGMLPLLLMRLSASGDGCAPGWQVRCPDCGRARDAGELGIIRIGATRRTKRILGSCSVCRGGLKKLLLEPVPTTDPALARPAGGMEPVRMSPPAAGT